MRKICVVKSGSAFERKFLFELRFVENLHDQCEKIVFLGCVERILEPSAIDDLKLRFIQ